MINGIVDVYNKSYQEKILQLKKDGFLNILKLKQDFSIIDGDEMLLNAYLRVGNSDKKLLSFSYNYSKNMVKCSCRFCEQRDSKSPCHHVGLMVEEFLKGEFEELIFDAEDITEHFYDLRESERQEELNNIINYNNSLLDDLVKMIKNTEHVKSMNKLILEPILYVQGYNKSTKKMDYKVEFKIGNSKMFIVKDILELLKDITNSEVKQFGKTTLLNLNINNFDEKSKKLITILNKIFYLLPSNSYVRTVTAGPEFIDDLFELYKNNILKVKFDNDFEETNLLISSDSKKVDVIIKDYSIEFINYNNENYHIIFGSDYDYIIVDNIIYKLEQKEHVRQLVRFKHINPNFNLKYVKNRFIKEVYSNVLDEVEVDEELKKDFLFKEFNIEAYFDINEDIVSFSTKYYADGEEVDINSIKDDIVSRKIYLFNSFIENLGFVDGKLTDVTKVAYFLNADFSDIRKIATIYLSENIKAMQIKKMKKVVSHLGYDTGMLTVCFEKLNYTDKELLKVINAIKKKVKFVKLNKDTIIEIDETEANKLLKIVEEFNLDVNRLSEKQTVPLYQSLKLLNNKDEFVDCSVDEILQNILNEIANYKNSNYEVPNFLNDCMRSYQVDAFKWMKTLTKYNFCGVLADDMGLGKTLEIIALLMSDLENAPSLIVCPKSLAYNWRNEFIKWNADIKVVNVNGTSNERSKIIKKIKNDEKAIYITSYDSLKNDLELYEEKMFNYVILDEAQFIKNHTTLKAKSVKQINSKHRFVLTGTPIENTVMDLWSLFDFLMPNYLYNYNKFNAQYEKEITSFQNNAVINKLVKKITPFILRRTKQEVLTDLPEKNEIIQYAEMDKEQRKIYEAQLLKTKQIITEGSNKIDVLSSLTRLRQICVDPSLFIEGYNGGSAKIDLVLELVKNYIDEGHKIIIFSQFTSAFERLEKELCDSNIKYFILTGKTDAFKRVEMANIFNIPESEEKVFLVSLKAGGTGLNLIGADVVIHLDPWWNVSAENQATDRAHRIGQKNIVQVIKLVCENSIEQKVIELQEIKKQIVSKVIADNDENIVNLSQDDLKYILS